MDRVVFLVVESRAYRLQVVENRVTSTPEEVLSSDQEEADTKMFLCCLHAIRYFSCENICIFTVDSDVAILNEARYCTFCTKAKVCDPQQLPPTKDELLLHCKRANYVTSIWKSVLVAIINPPHPTGYGWVETDGILEVRDQSLLMPGRGPEDIYLSSKGIW